nr:minichromosome maintenance complex component 4-like protein [Cryptomonas curvata]
MSNVNKKQCQIPTEIINIITRFKNFLEKFKSIESNYIYVNKILKTKLKSDLYTFDIDVLHLAEFDSFLYFNLVQNPSKTISLFDYTINRIVKNKKLNIQKILNRKIKIFLFCSNLKLIKDFDPADPTVVGSLVKLRGLVVSYSDMIPEMVTALYKCLNCYFEVYAFLEHGKIMEPMYCYYCKKFNTFQLIHHRCNFVPKRFIKIQPIYNKNINLTYNNFIVFNRNSNQLKIGEFVEIIGISRNIPRFFSSKIYQNFSFDSYIDGLFVVKLNFEIEHKLSINNTVSNQNLFINSFIKNKIILITSIIQNFYLYKIFMENFAVQNNGYETLKRVIFLQIISSKCCNFTKNKKKLSLLVLNHLDINTKAFLKSVRNSFKKKIFCNSEENTKNKSNSIYNINFFTFFFSKNIKNLPNCNKSLSFVNNFNSLHKKIFSKINEIVAIEPNFFNEKKKEYFLEKELSLIVTLSIKKKELFINKESKEKFALLNEFDLFYLIKSLSTINMDYKRFTNKLKCFSMNLKNYSKNNNIRYFKIGFNSNAVSSFLYELPKIGSPFFTKISTKNCLKWKNLINISIDFQEILKFGYFENFYDVLLWFSEASARLRLSNTIGSMDIRFSVLLLLEAIKSLKILKKKL